MSNERYWSAAPRGVKVYDSTHEFIAEKPSRQSTGFDIPGDLAGWDVADGFLLSVDGVNPDAQDEWRISVHDHDVYAVLRRRHGQEKYTFEGPVWLIGTVPDIIDAGPFSEPLEALTDSVKARRREFDSLLAFDQHDPERAEHAQGRRRGPLLGARVGHEEDQRRLTVVFGPCADRPDSRPCVALPVHRPVRLRAGVCLC